VLLWVDTFTASFAPSVVADAVDLLEAAGYAVQIPERTLCCALTWVSTGQLDVARRVMRRTLAEALDGHELDLAPLAAPAVAQFHCHQRAVTGTTADRAVLARLGVDVTSVDEGCCGLAGNVGFEPGHYDVSLRCDEQSFLPVLRGTAADTVVLADGFSCRLQIAQLTGREPLHLAQLLRRQLRAG
ncbi:MAG: (Fe-S)-binding protein, partial [Actinomycetota bacterium]|nr:(Fe-S)-binding protein [Actinomycetota bacterium]